MRDESEREAAHRERVGERAGERVPQLPPKALNLRLWRTLSEARLRSGDNAVITSFEYFTLSFPHFRFVSSSSTSPSLLELASSDEEERHAFAIANVSVTVFAACLPPLYILPPPLYLQ